MTVGNPENFKIQIKTGRDEVDNRVPCDFSNLTLKKLHAWIDSQQLSSALKSELKRSAASFPHQALPAWQRDFDRYLSKAQSRLRKKKKLGVVAPAVPEPLEGKDSPPLQLRAPSNNDFDDFESEVNEADEIGESEDTSNEANQE